MGQSLQQIIQGLLDKVLSMVNTPGNSYYLPTWMVSHGYDPYGTQTAMSWSVQLTDPNVISAAATICPSIQVFKETCPDNFSIGAPNTNPSLVLGSDKPGGMLVSGGSNAYVAALISDTFDPYLIIGRGTISSLPSPLPPNLVVSGDFTFTQYCCCSQDQTTCIATPVPVVGTGTFKATVNGPSQIQVNFAITKLAQGQLDIGVTSMTFTPPMQAGKQVPDITVTVDITNIPEGANRASYNGLAEEAFNSDAALQNVNQQINAVMNAPGQLQFIGKVLTQVIDGYLMDNHQYPFDKASLAFR
jgi:hypothetical protein